MIEVAYRQQSSKIDSKHPSFSRRPVTASSNESGYTSTSSNSSSSSPSSSSPAHRSASLLLKQPHDKPHSEAALQTLPDLSSAPLQIKPLKAPPSPLVPHAQATLLASQQHRDQYNATRTQTHNGLGLATGYADAVDSHVSATATPAARSAMAERSDVKAAAGQSVPAAVHRIRRGQKLEEIQSLNVSETPSLQQLDSPFQLQEYLALLVRRNPHDVDHIVMLPQATVAPTETFSGTSAKGKSKESASTSPTDMFMGSSGSIGGEEEVHMVDTDVWVYEQLRKIVADFTTPWLTALQRDCDRKERPSTCDAMNADDWMYLCASHGEEKHCCAIDYIIHTLDGTTALLNSQRHFPSRTYIPTTSLRHFGSVSRRLTRIFVHAYEHHRDVFETCEAETSLYARFLALVHAYDLVSVDALPRLGVEKAGKGEDGSVFASDKNAPVASQTEATAEDDDFVSRGAPSTHRKLFDSGHGGDVSGVPRDATGEDDEDGVEDEDEIERGSTEGAQVSGDTFGLRRSDSNASRITAIHVGGNGNDDENDAPTAGDVEQ